MKTINIAVIGAAGWIGTVHSECYSRLGPLLPGIRVNLHTAVDIVEENVRRVAEQYGFDRWATDYRVAVGCPDVDIIDICCNNSLHREIAVAAAGAGKAVLCEKPLAMSEPDAAEMVRAVGEAGVVHGCNLIHRKYPGIVFIKQLLEQGRLGTPYYMRAIIEQDSHADPGDMHAWLFSKEKAGGGSIATNGSHVIDLCRFLMGDFAEVVCHTETFIKERPKFREDQVGKASSLSFTGDTAEAVLGERVAVDVDDASAAIIRFRSGGFGVMMSSWAKQGTRHNVSIELVGSRGTAFFETERLNEVRLYENTGKRDVIGFTDIILGNEHPYGGLTNMKTGHGIGGKDVFTIMMMEFVHAVAEGSPMSPDFEDGRMAVHYLQCLQRSAEENRWVAVAKGGLA